MHAKENQEILQQSFFFYHRRLTTNKRSATCSHVEFRGLNWVSNGPTSSKFPIETPDAPYI